MNYEFVHLQSAANSVKVFTKTFTCCYLLIVIPGKWGSCNATCLIKLGVKHREVQCRDRQTDLLSDDCNLDRRPFDTKRCYYRRQCANEKNGNCICTVKLHP